MQMAIERIKTRIKDLEEESLTPIGESRVQGYRIVLSELISLLEKEKQQIIDAHNEGGYRQYLNNKEVDGEKYFNETFKQ